MNLFFAEHNRVGSIADTLWFVLARRCKPLQLTCSAGYGCLRGAQWELSYMGCLLNTRFQRLEAALGYTAWCETNDLISAISGL